MSYYPTIAFTDFEFSGLDPLKHEILEIGVVVAHSSTLEENARFECKIIPERLADADGASLAFIGYKEQYWQNAIPSATALSQYFDITRGSLFAAWKTPFDWTFLAEACRRAGVSNAFDHHMLDVFTVAYEALGDQMDLSNLKLARICEHLGIQKEPMPHRAINGADVAYQIYKKLKVTRHPMPLVGIEPTSTP